MKTPKYMDKKDLATGATSPSNSWQHEVHNHGKRFFGERPNPEQAAHMNREIEVSRIGKTIIQTFASGEQHIVEQYGTVYEISTNSSPERMMTVLTLVAAECGITLE